MPDKSSSDGEYVPDVAPKKKPPKSKDTSKSKDAPKRRRLVRGRNPTNRSAADDAGEKAPQPAVSSPRNAATPGPSTEYAVPPVRGAARKARMSIMNVSQEQDEHSMEDDNDVEEMADGEPQGGGGEDEEDGAGKSAKKGKKKARQPDYILQQILDKRVTGSYLTKWEPNWQPVKQDESAHKDQLEAWKSVKKQRKHKDYPKRMAWSYMPAHNPSSILGPPYGQEITHFTNGRGLPKGKGKEKEKEQPVMPPDKQLPVGDGIAWMEKHQGDIERELVRHLFDEGGRNGVYGKVIFPVVNDKARDTLLIQHKLEDPKIHPFALVRSEVRDVKNHHHPSRQIPPFLPRQTSDSPSFIDQNEKEIWITLMANPLHWGDRPLLPAVPCGALALRGLEVLGYHLNNGHSPPQQFWPRSFNVFNMLVDALVTKVCDPPGHAGLSYRTRETGDVLTTLNNGKERNANALTDVRFLPAVEVLGYDEMVRWWGFENGRDGGGEEESESESGSGEEVDDWEGVEDLMEE